MAAAQPPATPDNRQQRLLTCP